MYGDSAAELADSYAHLVIATDDSLIVRAGARGRIGISQVSLVDGSVQVLVDGPRCASPVGFVQGRPVFTTQSAEAPAELAVLDGGGERRLTNFASAQPVEVTRMTVPSELGPLDIWFIAPTGSVAPLPTVLLIHGGPNFTYGEAFNIDAHALCAAGFGVLFTNPRGSTGYGDEFTHGAISDWADGPARDLCAVLDAAIDAGLVDPTRLGVTGNSYGGYMSSWLAATTTRFKAHVPLRGRHRRQALPLGAGMVDASRALCRRYPQRGAHPSRLAARRHHLWPANGPPRPQRSVSGVDDPLGPVSVG